MLRSILPVFLLFASVASAQVELSFPESVPAGSEVAVGATGEPANGHMILVRLADGKRGSYGYPSISLPVKLIAPVEAGTYKIEYVVGDDVVASKTLAVTPVSASLKAPAELAALQDFELTFEGPGNAKDMFEIRGPDGNKLPGLDYDYARGVKSGAITMTAPEKPGDYTIIYQTYGKELARVPIRVRGVDASLEAPESVAMRSEFNVEFEGPGNHGDMVFVRGADGVRLAYGYPSDKTGSLTLTAPEAPGKYSLVYRTGETVLAEVPLIVTGSEATLDVPATVPAGADFVVGFQAPANRGDRIVVDLGGGVTGDYSYPQIHPDATLTLTAPEALGTFAVVYRAGDTELAREPFEVIDVAASLDAPEEVEGGLSFDVTWKAEGNRGDRIDMYATGATDPATWDYPIRGNPLQIRAPREAGEYELRYRTPSGRVLATRPIRVTPPDPDPGFLQVVATGSAVFGPDSGVEIILDASGSMLQKLGGKRRIDIAKDTLTQLLGEVIPGGTAFALRVFGHKEANACRTDLEIPLAPLVPAGAKAKVASITAMNLAKTPIGDSLGKVPEDLANVTGERVVILLTDGEETCDGDPAEAIRALEKTGVTVRVNVIGFAIDDEELRQTFEAWAALGNGEYFHAVDADQLAQALSRSVRPEFVVADAKGRIVARGRAGDAAIGLPAGTYEVRVERRAPLPVEVKSKATATVELH